MTGLLARTWRGLREHLYLHFVSTGVIATSLVLLGVFALAAVNLRHMVGAWEQDVHLSAYLRPGTDDGAREALRAAVAGRVEVAEARLVTEAEARAWLAERTPDLAPVLDELGADALPASLEITLRADWTTPEAIATFAESLEASGAYDEVDYGQEWVARVRAFLSMLGALGLVLGASICLATLFLVGNTTHLVVHARRDELEIMRLVGATDGFILGPFLVEGALQGLVAGAVAVGALYGVYRGLLAGAEQLLAGAVGAAGVSFLGAPSLALMLLGGVALGLTASWATVARFLRGLP